MSRRSNHFKNNTFSNNNSSPFHSTPAPQPSPLTLSRSPISIDGTALDADLSSPLTFTMPRSICDLPDPSEDDSWPIPGLLPEGLCLLSSKAPASSRTLALQLALSIASNTLALDHFAPTSGQVLYFSFHEHERTFMARTRHMLGDNPLPNTLAFTSGAISWLEHGIAALTQCLRDFPQTRLIVIDSLSSLFPPTRFWSARCKQALLDQLNRLAHDHRLCILLLHTQARHSRHDPFDAIACPPLLLEAIETLFVLEHDRTLIRAVLYLSGPLMPTHHLKLHMPTNNGRWHLSNEEATFVHLFTHTQHATNQQGAQTSTPDAACTHSEDATPPLSAVAASPLSDHFTDAAPPDPFPCAVASPRAADGG